MSVRIDVHAAERVGVVTLDEPQRRNSLTAAAVEALVAGFDRLESSGEVGSVVVTGAPPAFCAGADLSDLGGSKEAGLRAIYEGFLRVARSPLPTIAAVNGPAVGAGMNLALACDVRLAGRSARFETRFLDLGLHPGGGHTWMLQRAVGPQAAAAMVLFGEVLDGAAAADRGLVWRCVDDGDLLPTALAMAAKASAAPPELAAQVKDSLRATAAIDRHDDAVDHELAKQVWSMEQPFFAERLAAVRSRVTRR